MDLELLQTRAAIIKNIRSFFDERKYLELDTPLLSPDLIPESCLEVFQTERVFPYGSIKENKPLWLIPSPEIWMKKIIAQHKTDVYQICKCFRNGESEGHLHSSEFTMLEYYTMNVSYLESLKITEELIAYLIMSKEQRAIESAIRSKEQSNLYFEKESILPFERITVAQAFEKWAGFDLFEAAKDISIMEREAHKLGIDPLPGMTIPELYDLIFIHSVEPKLKTANPLFLLDYPAFVSCLAKKGGSRKEEGGSEENKKETVERWELYWNGIELANCFSEETDPLKVKEFFTNEAAEKERHAIVKHKVDHDYWKLFEGFPKCSGVAMGVDRLIMALTGKRSIDGVLAFEV